MRSTRSKKHDGICARINMNIPSDSRWCWDDMFDTALVVFDKCDMDVIYIPITQEFDNQWDFTTIEQSPSPFYAYFNRVFGVVPGQKVFTSTNASGTILFAVWWPWGDGNKISLRVGLFNSDRDIDRDLLKSSLCRLLPVQDQPADT